MTDVIQSSMFPELEPKPPLDLKDVPAKIVAAVEAHPHVLNEKPASEASIDIGRGVEQVEEVVVPDVPQIPKGLLAARKVFGR